MIDFNNIFLIPFVLVLLIILKHDIKTSLVSDLYMFLLAATVLLKNGFEETSIYNNAISILIGIGSVFFVKIVLENAVWVWSKGKNSFRLGEADILLAGILAAFFSPTEFLLFVYMIFIVWLIVSSVKRTLRGSTTKNTTVKIPFVPYIILGFLLTEVIMYLYKA